MRIKYNNLNNLVKEYEILSKNNNEVEKERNKDDELDFLVSLSILMIMMIMISFSVMIYSIARDFSSNTNNEIGLISKICSTMATLSVIIEVIICYKAHKLEKKYNSRLKKISMKLYISDYLNTMEYVGAGSLENPYKIDLYFKNKETQEVIAIPISIEQVEDTNEKEDILDIDEMKLYRAKCKEAV